MCNEKCALTRRDWLAMSSIALGGLALPISSGRAESTIRPLRARLSLNENPFGPSRFALAAIRNQFGEICRYVDEGADVLTQAIVAREGVSADQIVLGEILESLGLHLAMHGQAEESSSIRRPVTLPWWTRWPPVEAWS
ncbi:MAG: histidinol-phosphate aminotransferase [Rhodospirillaceae bacterium]|nr:histidinol-phosphate aminotransferase [Rhodospirillaceae bacterium]